MHIRNRNAWVLAEVLAKLGDEYIHTTAYEIAVVAPNHVGNDFSLYDLSDLRCQYFQ
jgi:hypothetical protein